MVSHIVSRMVGSRFMAAVALFLALTVIYYMYSYVQENHMLHYELSEIAMKLRRVSKFESKYRTSHNNENLYEQSNRQLKNGLARQEKEVADLHAELEQEKVKLGKAYLFYTDIKHLFSMDDQSESDVGKVVQAEPVTNHVRGVLSQWKADEARNELLKKNLTQLTNVYKELNEAHESLHQSNLRLQGTNVNNFNHWSALKKSHDNLLTDFKNLTNLYTRQLSINRHLQKDLNIFKKNNKSLVDASGKGRSPVEAGKKGKRPVVAGKKGKRPVVAGKKGKRPVVAGKKGKRPVVAGKKGKRPVVAGEKGKRPLDTGEKGKRPVDAGENGTILLHASEEGRSTVNVVEKSPVEVVKKPLAVHGSAAKLKNTTIGDLAEEKNTKTTKQPSVEFPRTDKGVAVFLTKINGTVESGVVTGNETTNLSAPVKQGQLENAKLDKYTGKSEITNANVSSIDQKRTSNLHKKGERTVKMKTRKSLHKKRTRNEKKSSKGIKKHRKDRGKPPTPVSMPAKIEKQRTQHSTTAVPTPAANKESDKSMTASVGNFDEEDKHSPPHIDDVLDENGLSLKATAD